MSEEFIHGRSDPALTPNLKVQIGAKASFSVHLDTDAAPAKLLASSSAVPATEAKDQLDLFSIDINYHEEKYQIKTRMVSFFCSDFPICFDVLVCSLPLIRSYTTNIQPQLPT
jgi:hypothetical protein